MLQKDKELEDNKKALQEKDQELEQQKKVIKEKEKLIKELLSQKKGFGEEIERE